MGHRGGRKAHARRRHVQWAGAVGAQRVHYIAACTHRRPRAAWEGMGASRGGRQAQPHRDNIVLLKSWDDGLEPPPIYNPTKSL